MRGVRVGVAAAVAGYRGDQLENAAVIIAAGMRAGIGFDGQVLGVMTAMGESSLHNLDHGDGAINPDGTVADSLGLFQQQHGWGSRIERMTPAIAAARFFQHLAALPGWAAMTPPAAAHAVQRNADPVFYTPYYLPARQLVLALREPTARASTPCPVRVRPGRLPAGPAAEVADMSELETTPYGTARAVPSTTWVLLPDQPAASAVGTIAGISDTLEDELREQSVQVRASLPW